MSALSTRIALALIVVGLSTALVPAVGARASITGPCTATALAQSSGIDVTSQTVWHVRSTDVIVGAGQASAPQTHVTVNVEFFGLPIPFAPIADRHGGAATSGSGGYLKVLTYSPFARVLAVHGSTDDCIGKLILVVDDVSVLSTLIGILSLAILLLSVVALIAIGFVRRPVIGPILGAVIGFFAGVGGAEFLQQTGFLDPTSLSDLAIPFAGVLAGVLVAGNLARGGLQGSLSAAP